MSIQKEIRYSLGTLNAANNNLSVTQATTINNLTTISLEILFTPELGGTSTRILVDNNIISIQWSDLIYFQHKYATTNGIWTVPKGVPGTKYHLVATFNNASGDPTVYVDGVSVTPTETSTPAGAATTGANNWIIGSQYDGTNPCNSNIFKFAIYNAQITASNVLALYNMTIHPNDLSSCKLYHDYTRGSANDLSGNGNNGTLKVQASFAENVTTYFSSVKDR